MGSGVKGLDRMRGIPVVPAAQQSKADGQPAKPYLKTNTKAVSVALWRRACFICAWSLKAETKKNFFHGDLVWYNDMMPFSPQNADYTTGQVFDLSEKLEQSEAQLGRGSFMLGLETHDRKSEDKLAKATRDR